MELWEQKFLGMFVYKRPVCQYPKTYKFLKAVHARYDFKSFLGKEISWYQALEKVSLVTENGKIVGESYLDGTGWFKHRAYPRGRGVYSKWHQMERLVREHTQIVGETIIDRSTYHQDNMLHFRMKPQNLLFLSSSKGFNDFVSAKYATAGFKA